VRTVGANADRADYRQARPQPPHTCGRTRSGPQTTDGACQLAAVDLVRGRGDALEALSPPVERALDRYLARRTTGPLFLDDHDPSLDHAGVALQDTQDAMGHADPRTTRRYMASHQHLARHAIYAFAAWLRRTPDAADQPTGD
jgi:hypothetical protein